VRILGASDPVLRKKMAEFQSGLERLVAEKDEALRTRLMD
jgi:5-(carboxyamino)imidazole ribonucleotide mutase